MPFPISITGTIFVPKDRCRYREIEKNVVRIEDLLNAAGVKTLSREGTSVLFTSGLSRMVLSNWNILAPFDSGRVDVGDDGGSISAKYKASTLQLFVMVSLTMIVFAIFFGYQSHNFAKTVPVWVFGFGWLWLLGMNYFVGAIRFRRWLRRGLERPDFRTC